MQIEDVLRKHAQPNLEYLWASGNRSGVVVASVYGHGGTCGSET